jgi:hypothetical protein
VIETTPAHEFLGEIVDIDAFITDVIDCSRKSSWHWPSFYLAYVEVDRILGLLTRVGHHFESPFAALGEPLTAEESAQGANELFAQLTRHQKAVVRWLFQMARTTSPGVDDPAPHRRLEAHVHPKSGWYQTFMDEYRCGVVSADGKTLARTVLPVAPVADCERIDHISASCMLRHQQFDLGAPVLAGALAHAAHEAGRRLGKIAGAMNTHLVENCTIHDLMYPSSR